MKDTPPSLGYSLCPALGLWGSPPPWPAGKQLTGSTLEHNKLGPEIGRLGGKREPAPNRPSGLVLSC